MDAALEASVFVVEAGDVDCENVVDAVDVVEVAVVVVVVDVVEVVDAVVVVMGVGVFVVKAVDEVVVVATVAAIAVVVEVYSATTGLPTAATVTPSPYRLVKYACASPPASQANKSCRTADTRAESTSTRSTTAAAAVSLFRRSLAWNSTAT